MKRNDMRWLLVGLFSGLAIAGFIFAVRQYVLSPRTPEIVTASAPPATQLTPDDSSTADAAASVALTADEQKSIGIETVEVKRQTIRKEITVPGKVAEPETGIGVVSARIGGRIETLLVNVTGQTVVRGQPVALIYSPDLFTIAEEYKLAIESRERLSASKEPQAIAEADELVRASRRRLEIKGLTPQQIQDITSSPETSIQITTYSPVSGVITARNVAEGQYVKEGDVLYTVTDLSTVWVQAQIFESDIPLIHIGQTAAITAPGAAGSLRGTINFIEPAVEPQTRTMMARIQVANPQMRLRPGMFVQVSLETSTGSSVVAVPRSAVLDTGQDKVVYVAREGGVFEKRSIEAAASGDEYYAVAKGLTPGERVVTHGNFLLDSQTRLSGNITGMFGGSKAFSPDTGYAITFRTGSSVAKGGTDEMYHVTVTDPDGKPVADAQVQVGLLMPAMPAMGMGEMRSSYNLAWNGSDYAGAGTIAMAGSWNVTVEARRDGQLLGVYRTRLVAK